MLRRGSVRVAALTAAAWLIATAPAWANMANPELYPEAAARYERGMMTLFWGTIGCLLLALIVFTLAVVLLVRWILRRNQAKSGQTPSPEAPTSATAGPAPAPAPTPAPEHPETE